MTHHEVYSTNITNASTAQDSQAHEPEINCEDIVIAVMGMTGAGKSTFISLCTRTESIIGHDLTSYTSRTAVYTLMIGQRKVHLIDTPGFDDSGRTETEILAEIAFWLGAAHENKIFLSGLVYLHRITNPRLQGAALRSLNIFKAMCGRSNFAGVIMGTTGWEELTPAQTDLAVTRQEELTSTSRFWGEIIEGKGRVVSLTIAALDAMRIVRHIVARDRRYALNLQTQLVEDQLSLFSTDAGRILFKNVMIQPDYLDEQRQALKRDFSAFSTELSKQIHAATVSISDDTDSLDTDIERLHMNHDEIKSHFEKSLEKDKELLLEASHPTNLDASEVGATLTSANLASQASRHLSPVIAQSIHLGMPDPQSSSVSSNNLQRTRSAQSIFQERRYGQKRKIEPYVLQQQTHSIRRGPAMTAMSVIGTGLAAGQLIAALACTVM